MAQREVFERIKKALETAPRNAYVAELHAQILKHSEELDSISGKEFCAGMDLGAAWATEFSKMRKLAPRLRAAGMDPNRI